LYYVIEPTLLESDKALLDKIHALLVEELDVDVRKIASKEEAQKLLREKVMAIVKGYKISIGTETLEKLMYYLTRNFIYHGRLEPLMRDHMIEDVSCDGPNVPIYIWHRQYESIPTNVKFEGHKELDNFVIKLAYLCGKHISIASPIVDGGLADGSRLQLTFAKEVTRHGSSFSMRRFKADPLTVTDLISFNTLSSEMGAYFWYALEKKACILVAGGTASGKTTLLNCISMFILPDNKIITIEDTPELNLLHKNWIASIARLGFGTAGSSAEITLFDLLKAAMRQRPDYIIVGEVRGEEAFTLFQAMATGHGGLSSLHADSVLSVVRRLESAPLNIPRTLLPTLNLICVQSRMRIGNRPARRLIHMADVLGIDPSSGEVDLNDVFKWEPRTDSFTYSGRSHTVDRLAERAGLTRESVQEEMQRRKTVLEYMVKKNIRRYADVGVVIRDYYMDPTKTFEKARLGLLSE
ncbi:MAG TPA: type II/IV secretion system ATPase subunit, partial [Methylomirabilota bacterium]|nr:type II/IV secretion system ATPase subunit [Methylomirabilota bacterium]